jgi:hypothetical protein
MYKGRPIIYYGGHNYEIKFKYKIIKGSSKPFKVGWFARETKTNYIPYNLPMIITPLKDNWFQVSCTYLFLDSYYNPASFLSDLEDNTVVDVTNIEMYDQNRCDTIPLFVDQKELYDKGIWQNIELGKNGDGGNLTYSLNLYASKKSQSFSGYVLFACPRYKILNVRRQKYSTKMLGYLPLISIIRSIKYSKDKSFEAFLGDFIHTDTTYYPLNENIAVDTIENQLYGGRMMRWNFAYKIFNLEYNTRKKIFGGGLNFLNWSGYYFLNDKTAADYPHNPLISVLLYSGIIGLIIYLILLFQIFNYYFSYFKTYYVFSTFFLIAFFFTFFSGGSPLDPPVMGFFVILALLINYVHQKEYIIIS